MIFVILQLISTLMVLLHFREDRGNAGCFWSRVPPRPPPRDHPVGYCMWVGNYYIIYKVNKTGGLGGVVEWGSTRPKTTRFAPILATKPDGKMCRKRERFTKHHTVC